MKKLFALVALLITSSLNAATVNLAWDPSPTTTVTAYKIYETVATGNPFNLVATVSSSTLSFSRTATQTMRYYVTAYDGASGLESAPSNIIIYTPPVVAPAPPSNLRATTITASRIDVGWDPVNLATTSTVQ